MLKHRELFLGGIFCISNVSATTLTNIDTVQQQRQQQHQQAQSEKLQSETDVRLDTTFQEPLSLSFRITLLSYSSNLTR